MMEMTRAIRMTAAAAVAAGACALAFGAAPAPQAEARSATVGTPHVQSFKAANWKVKVKSSKVRGASGYQFDIAPANAKRVRAAQAGRMFVRDLWWSPLDRPKRVGTAEDGLPLYRTAHFPVKAKVRAYKAKNGKRAYGKWSKAARIYEWEVETPEYYMSKKARLDAEHPGTIDASRETCRQFKKDYPYCFPKAESWKWWGLA